MREQDAGVLLRGKAWKQGGAAGREKGILVAWEHRLSVWGPRVSSANRKSQASPINLSVGVRSSESFKLCPATSLALFITPTIGWPLPAPSLLVGLLAGSYLR